MSYHHPPVSHSISSPPSPHHATDRRSTSPIPPLHSSNSTRRSSICTPTSEISYFTQTQNQTPHRRSRSFRDGSRSPRSLPHRYTTFEFDNASVRESSNTPPRQKSPTNSGSQKRPRSRPPPLQCTTFSNVTQQSTSSTCSSASTTQTFFNTSTESSRSNYSNRITQPCSPSNIHGSNSNWSMCSEYSTTSSVKAQNANFPKGKLAYLASRR